MAFRPLFAFLSFKTFTPLLIRPFWPCYSSPYPTLFSLIRWTTATPLILSFSFSLSMTPIYLNPLPSPFPLVELKEDQNIQLFINPPNQAGPSCPTFFNTTQYQRDSEQQHEQKVYKHISHGESSDHQVLTSSSSMWASTADDGDDNKSEHGSVKWMSSKMRLMRKMMNSNCPGAENSIRTEQNLHDHHQHGNNGEINFSDNSNNTTIRVCAGCNTTKTPLWRSGPRGPKTLCNACGIRQRKARRAMAAAAAAAANGTELDAAEASFTKTNNIKVISREKKSRTGHVTQFNKKQCKQLPGPPDQTKKKLCFEDFALSLSKNSSFQRVFPQDEEEGAILLMALSCGLVHS